MCRRRYQTYHTDPLNSQAVFVVAPRGRRGHCCSPRHQYKADKRQLRHEYRHPELYSAAQHQESLLPVSPAPQRVPQQVTVVSGGAHSCHARRRRGPVSGMAALLLGAVGFGTLKIQESREKKKAKKAALEWEAEQTAAKTAREASRREKRSSEDARNETGNSSTDAEGELPPPAYDDVVGGGSGNSNVAGADRSGGRLEMPAVVPSELSAQKTGASGRGTMLDV